MTDDEWIALRVRDADSLRRAARRTGRRRWLRRLFALPGFGRGTGVSAHPPGDRR